MTIKPLTGILVSLFFMSQSAHSARDCFELAGRYYKIDPDLLRAVAWHESRYNMAAIGRNKDGSIDVGIMQINSRNFSHLEKFGITQHHLKNDPCMNIYTGAYYLSVAFNRWGINWVSVGAYNAGFKKNDIQNKRRKIYAENVYNIYTKIKYSKIAKNTN
ncbi:transglycosylase SLT domain-containing protein [Sodalis endosymbiont of Spalangia cameroni]|uniref:transglycosylase SLT domain-containing protein n=1 Tax=Sodalis praecaptivus TaxID=1239307 RepID=UPI0031F9F6AE